MLKAILGLTAYMCTKHLVVRGQVVHATVVKRAVRVLHQGGSPDQRPAAQAPLQQLVVHQRRTQQQRREAAGDERHEARPVRQQRRRELRDVPLRRLVARIQPDASLAD